MDEIRHRQAQDRSDVPLYLTLPGALGLDIHRMVSEGLLHLTETGAIADPEDFLVVAIESNSDAASNLSRSFPGLQILRQSVRDVLRGDNVIRLPEGAHLDICRALVVNLDLNSPLHAEEISDDLEFIPIRTLRKIAHVQEHHRHPEGWSLCLTLHSELVVSDVLADRACQYLFDQLTSNFQACPGFKEAFEQVTESKNVSVEEIRSLCTLSGEGADPTTEQARQRFLLIAVAKLIVDQLTGLGWEVQIHHAAFYGGDPAAPMLTWIVRFAPPVSGTATAERICQALEAFPATMDQSLALMAEGVAS